MRKEKLFLCGIKWNDFELIQTAKVMVQREVRYEEYENDSNHLELTNYEGYLNHLSSCFYIVPNTDCSTPFKGQKQMQNCLFFLFPPSRNNTHVMLFTKSSSVNWDQNKKENDPRVTHRYEQTTQKLLIILRQY